MVRRAAAKRQAEGRPDFGGVLRRSWRRHTASARRCHASRGGKSVWASIGVLICPSASPWQPESQGLRSGWLPCCRAGLELQHRANWKRLYTNSPVLRMRVFDNLLAVIFWWLGQRGETAEASPARGTSNLQPTPATNRYIPHRIPEILFVWVDAICIRASVGEGQSSTILPFQPTRLGRQIMHLTVSTTTKRSRPVFDLLRASPLQPVIASRPVFKSQSLECQRRTVPGSSRNGPATGRALGRDLL